MLSITNGCHKNTRSNYAILYFDVHNYVHYTDVPVIISGEKVAYLEPQERIWDHQTGRSFTLSELQDTDNLAPFNEISDFRSSGMTSYSKTIFRFPLRKEPSALSENLYDVPKIHELIHALREEAKYLLVFLRSIDTIEVYDISSDGTQTLCFKTEISDKYKRDIGRKRKKFLDDLKLMYDLKAYDISSFIEFTAKFSIEVSGVRLDQSQCGRFKWLVANQVGSDNMAVLAAAEKQKVFPWVGTALELTSDQNNGRIFCFLPMPIEAASNLPVHVNGTFGLTDDRRSLKWPGTERKNDPTADWNKMIANQILPRCYVTLLRKAKDHLQHNNFYKTWPGEKILKGPWGDILKPIYASLFEYPIIWSKAHKKEGEWIEAKQGFFVPRDSNIETVIQQCLVSCGVKVVDVPRNVWYAMDLASIQVKEIKPKLVRNKISTRDHSSYLKLSKLDKFTLLDYCLADGQYQDLATASLVLLPLSDGTFVQFRKRAHKKKSETTIYVCSDTCPSYLLPNLQHLIVDLTDINISLHNKLLKVAESKMTHIKPLTVEDIAKLIDQAMPSSWKNSERVTLPDEDFPAEWFEKFWKWVEGKKLHIFANKLILPVAPHKDVHDPTAEFCAIRLTTSRSVIYIPSSLECEDAPKEAINKLQVSICWEKEFPFVRHKNLKTYVHAYDTNGLLDAISAIPNYGTVKFSTNEADELKNFLKPSALTGNPKRVRILEELGIFVTAHNSGNRLSSVLQVKSDSTLKKAMVAPLDLCLDVSKLPPTLIMFSQVDQHQSQVQLLQKMNVTFPSDSEFISKHLLPMIRAKSIPDNLVDEIMIQILDAFYALSYNDKTIAMEIKSLPFVRVSMNAGHRKCPLDLYDPRNHEIAQIYKRESVFPISPYDKESCLIVLEQCGLRTVITPSEILDIIASIGTSPGPHPQHVNQTIVTRAGAILNYISNEKFLEQLSDEEDEISFSNKLKELSTTKSWLPVLSKPPNDYPLDLKWKGREYDSHVMSLQAFPCYVLSTEDCDRMPSLVGSQMYLSDPALPPRVAQMLLPVCDIVQHVISQLQEIVKVYRALTRENTSSLVHQIYQELMDSNHQQKTYLNDPSSEWLYIRKSHIFVSLSVVASEQNSTFRQNLEPYIYQLPESLVNYTQLFQKYGMNEKVSQSQILSVLEKIRDHISRSDNEIECRPDEAWNMVMNILNWLTNNGSKDVSDLIQEVNVYIPIDSEAESEWPQLENATNVVFTDSEFLRDFAISESDTSILFSHSGIYPKMAECLGLKLLTDEMDISEDAFEDTGQHEPLTQRLKTILKDYKDGLTIIKELLQNADDAEATEFNICYDSRTHILETKKLFFQGMSESHGPALVVHNNRTFSNDDFVNITKLAGATKENKQLKIGKFGIGFCSVYHITDVPSFVSRDLLHIFDPTLTHLKKEVKNPSQPGKKVKFTQKIISKSQQLDPYVGLFGFDKKQDYKGTMFRLPFRTSPSELSGTCYTDGTIHELMDNLQGCTSKLILFLQHINRITFQHIRNGESEPTILFEIVKEPVSLAVNLPQKVQLNKIYNSSSQSSEYWLVAENESNFEGKYATASVACTLNFDEVSSYSVRKKLDGEAFCFLPLSQSIGFPVHISGNFAVINNRRGLWTSDEATHKADTEVKWNLNMMKLVVPKAYHSLLIALQRMHSEKRLSEYNFYDFWPLEEKIKISNPWKYVIVPLYKLLMRDELFYSTTKKWLTLQSCKVLDSNILSLPPDNTTPECVSEIMTHLKIPLVNLPENYKQHLDLNTVLITEKKFIELFFQNLKQFDVIKDSRNEMVQCLLEVYASDFDDGTTRSYFLDNYLRKYSCIPSSPNGTVLKKCSELIDPESKFADLYDRSEHHFPAKEIASRHLSSTALHNLGMLYEIIPWNMLIERAQTIPTLMKTNKVEALERVKLILYSIKNHTEKDPPSTGILLHDIPFLPVLTKPDGYPLDWRGDNAPLLCGSQLVLVGLSERYQGVSNTHTHVAGAQVMFLCEKPPKDGGCGSLDRSLRKILHIKQAPSCDDAIHQLKQLIDLSKSKVELKIIDEMCAQIYAFLDREIKYARGKEKPTPKCIGEMKRINSVWTGSKFIGMQCIAKKWTLNGPYLYQVPSILSGQVDLCSTLDIKEEFTEDDLKSTLQDMSIKFKNCPIDKDSQEVFSNLIPLLRHLSPPEFSNFKIMLPDENFIMRRSDNLAYNDADWAPHDDKYTYVNGSISKELAKQLLIKPVSSELLEKYVLKEKSFFAGSEFGQREELTQRIQNILRDYPFNITLLKELLQNADDAKATKMCIILDKRSHRKDKVLSENWQKLQGPALLVWNNSVFTDKDLKGIQQLGLGSKRSDNETIGQYGIGFNVVYHLTDCPSFVTGENTLCILDPHCHFIPGATPKAPGRIFSGDVWENYSGIKSAYLRGGLNKTLPELQGGSLFRFPLRCTRELSAMSEIVDNSNVPEEGECTISAQEMHKHLNTWAPKMKNAMFFLNHVTELKFCVIEENSTDISIEYSYKTCVDDAAKRKRALLHDKISNFKNVSGDECCLIDYPLTLIDSTPNSVMKEEWIVQQGVGDVCNAAQKWQFVKQVKPKHGLASPLHFSSSDSQNSSTQEGRGRNFEGQVFCFLPLPIFSNLPVHINGNFILNSSRSNLWFNIDMDDRTRWNANLIRAVGSSYEKFLSNIKQYFFPQTTYKSWPPLIAAIHSYYDVFPQVGRRELDKKWSDLAEDVYEKLVSSNAQVMMVTRSSGPSNASAERSKVFTIQWHRCIDSSSSKIYFWKSRESSRDYDQKTIRPILEDIGMKITSAPLRLMGHFNEALAKKKCVEIVSVSPQAVYSYYTKYYNQCSSTGFPAAIKDTSFSMISNFKIFTSYVLLSEWEYQSQGHTFPEPPFGFPLLLTEDEKLRCFDKAHMTVKSEFAHLFPSCQSQFLHHDLLDCYYSSAYFIDSQNGLDVVRVIFTKSLPSILFSTTKANNDHEQIISKDKLKSIWECFSKDALFEHYLPEIIKLCAIIPATNGYLFTSKNPLQPVVVTPKIHQQYISTVEVLKSLGMPFVDTAIARTDRIGCPSLVDYREVLTSLYHLFQERDISASMNGTRVSTIVELLKGIDYRYDPQSCGLVKSLPIYEAVDGKFVSINETEVYMWPEKDTMCDIAYSKWSKHVNVIFLNRSAVWKDLASREVLSIQSIAAEDLYVKFIFPRFSHLSDDERYTHLDHLKNLYDINKPFKESALRFSGNYQKSQRANNFINALRDLKCLKSKDGILRRINEFCDHKQVIFTNFSMKFQFLPDKFREPNEEIKWMDFFKELGLRETVTKNEYQEFCTEVSKGNHGHLTNASTVLVKHLLSDAAKAEAWHYDAIFLSKISHIPFVVAKKDESLNWIVKEAEPNVTIAQGGIMISLTSPCQACTLDCSTLLWTVKPMVDLHLPCFQTHESISMLKNLKVTENSNATSSDVIENISNISNHSHFANFDLFDSYPESMKQPEAIQKGLMQVMKENFQHLSGNVSDSEISTLSSLPCIPVYSVPLEAGKRQLVLVKPCYVVSCEVKNFHPYLHSLPDDLHAVLPVMTSIGVRNKIDMSHIQAILEMAYTRAEDQILEVNTQKCVVDALKKLKFLLADTEKKDAEDIGKILAPLYLPSTEGKLELSTSLMYGDTSAYRGHLKLNLQDIEYAQLHIRMNDYILFGASQFCDALPENVRPKRMSDICEQNIVSQCDKVADSEVTSKIKETLKIKLISTAALKIILHYIKDDSISDKIKNFLDDFLCNIKVLTVRGLKTAIKIRDSGINIGTATTDFFLQCQENHNCCLYLDAKITVPMDDWALSELADYIMRQIAKEKPQMEGEARRKIREMLKLLFKVQNGPQIENLLEKEDIAIQSQDMDLMEAELGREIPHCWHHRLDQDIDNIFYPTEWVGYEQHENHIVFSQIGYPILPNDQTDLDSIPRVHMRYKIYTKKDDVEGIDVSGLDLFKFIKGKAKVKIEQDSVSGHAVVIYEGDGSSEEKMESEEDRVKANAENLKSIKEKIREELKEIWKLPEDLKKKAIKRMYLKWHPDKNPDDPEFAEEVFKFLKSQVERLENGQGVSSDDEPGYTSHQYRSRWAHDFSTWDQTARDHFRWFNYEQKYHSSGFAKSHNYSGSTSDAGWFFQGSDDDAKKQQLKNIREGRRWVEQAEVDFGMLEANLSLSISDPSLRGYGLVCFLSHQVAEKALQGGVFAICGEDRRKDHNLSRRAYMVQARKLGLTFGLLSHVAPLERYYLDSRYPNQWEGYDNIPADHFTASDASEAVKNATFVLEMVKSLMPDMN